MPITSMLRVNAFFIVLDIVLLNMYCDFVNENS